MQLRSTNAKHKLAITAFILAVFAVPFVMQWASVNAVDTQAVLAGGAVIGNQAVEKQHPAPVSFNNASQAMSVSGNSFLGASAQ